MTDLTMFAFPADPNSSIGFSGAETYIYRLTLTTGPFVDHVEPLTLGNASRLTVRGWNLPEETMSLSLHPKRYSLPEPTSLILDRLPRAQGPSLRESELDQSSLTFPAHVTGTIAQPKETDTYTFTGSKGQAVFVSAVSQPFDSPLDPLLKLFGPDGKLIKDILEDVADNLFNTDPYYQQGGDMVRIGGMGYTIDVNAAMGSRISGMTLLKNGEAIDPGKEYAVAGWASVNEATEGPPIWDVVEAHLAKNPVVTIEENRSVKVVA